MYEAMPKQLWRICEFFRMTLTFPGKGYRMKAKRISTLATRVLKMSIGKEYTYELQ